MKILARKGSNVSALGERRSGGNGLCRIEAATMVGGLSCFMYFTKYYRVLSSRLPRNQLIPSSPTLVIFSTNTWSVEMYKYNASVLCSYIWGRCRWNMGQWTKGHGFSDTNGNSGCHRGQIVVLVGRLWLIKKMLIGFCISPIFRQAIYQVMENIGNATLILPHFGDATRSENSYLLKFQFGSKIFWKEMSKFQLQWLEELLMV